MEEEGEEKEVVMVGEEEAKVDLAVLQPAGLDAAVFSSLSFSLPKDTISKKFRKKKAGEGEKVSRLERRKGKDPSLDL